MNLEDKLKRITENFAYKILLHQFNLAIPDKKKWAGEKIDEAVKEILSLLASELPKEKQGIKFHGGRQNSELSAYSPTDNQKIGYNQCLSDIKKKWGVK